MIAKHPGVGDAVVINTPENPAADGQPATVEAVEAWGCRLTTGFGSGHFRALWAEMEAPRKPAIRTTGPVAVGVKTVPSRSAVKGAKEQGYSGDACPTCGSFKMRRNGSCLLCESCASTTGCS